MIETALAPYKVGINGITIPILIPLLRCFLLPNTLCTMKRSPFPDSSAERTSYVSYALAGMSGTIPLISGILTQSKSKFKGDYYGLQLQSGKARI